MKSRVAASLALAAAVIAGAAGCSFITPQSTTIDYSASNGVNVENTGPVLVRGALVVANEAGTAGNFIGAAINTSASAQTLSIQVEGAAPQTVSVPAGESVVFGGDEAPLALADFSGKPGTTVGIFFQSGNELGQLAQVPVLDGSLPYYANLAP